MDIEETRMDFFAGGLTSRSLTTSNTIVKE